MVWQSIAQNQTIGGLIDQPKSLGLLQNARGDLFIYLFIFPVDKVQEQVPRSAALHWTRTENKVEQI